MAALTCNPFGLPEQEALVRADAVPLVILGRAWLPFSFPSLSPPRLPSPKPTPLLPTPSFPCSLSPSDEP